MTVRDSITRTRARTPGVEDDPTSATVRDRALGPTQCGISDVATKCTKGGRKPNICRCMLGAVLSWRCLGRHRLRCQPCSRIGENPPYGMIGGIEETSASSKPDPRLDPTRLRGGGSVMSVPTAISEMSVFCNLGRTPWVYRAFSYQRLFADAEKGPMQIALGQSDICEFESYMASHAVCSPDQDEKPCHERQHLPRE